LSFRKKNLENFNISENNIISVGSCKGTMQSAIKIMGFKKLSFGIKTTRIEVSV
jgi:hypothetical protein